MTNIDRAAALLLAPLTLMLGTAAMANRASNDLTCEIRARAASGGLQLAAVASASAPVSGEYEFVIAKSGAGGTSDVTQGGEFEVSPGKPAILGEVALGANEGASVKAVLTLRAAGGKSCVSRYPQPV